MNNPTSTPADLSCPPWCLGEHCDGPAPLHMAADRHMAYLAEGDGYPMEVQVQLLRADWPGGRGTPVITVGARHQGERLWDGLHPDDPLSADDADRLTDLLRAAAADARREWPVCLGCGHEFNPDHGPELERCCQCSERDETEADR